MTSRRSRDLVAPDTAVCHCNFCDVLGCFELWDYALVTEEHDIYVCSTHRAKLPQVGEDVVLHVRVEDDQT